MEVINKERVRWQCRRGMLELDLLLLPFVDRIYETLTREQQQDFIELLTHSDQELFEWLIGKSEPTSSAFSFMVKLIRDQSWQE